MGITAEVEMEEKFPALNGSQKMRKYADLEGLQNCFNKTIDSQKMSKDADL